VYEPLDARVDLPAMERDVLAQWRDTKVFQRSLEQTASGPTWVFYDGPPTANGMPGIHHVEARAFKDAFPRYRTMRGYHVPRRAGWDCHGLPIELSVEKELGFTGKADIEAFGVAAFNAKCRESVLRNVDVWERMTERMGFWVDLTEPYRTMDAEYVESVWWAVAQIHAKGLLVEDHRVAPYCPRCQTPLSSHELGQPGVYTEVESPSVYVRMPITSGEWAGRADLLVWTTTPWTLVSNTAVAVHPDVDYVFATHPDEEKALVVAAPLLEAALGEGWTVAATVRGADLERVTYQRPFDLVEFPAPAHYVVLGDYVTTEDGTGLVHQAPAFGADDLAVCRRYELPVVNPVRADGTFQQSLPLVGGQFFKKADKALVDDLRERGLLFRYLPYRHAYPHCWRCHTPLMYYALPSWYIRTTAVKDALVAQNEATNWYPATIKHGRYGDWLANNVDWALSRNRYWGTPLPVWRCLEGHVTVVGSRSELGTLAGRDLSDLDPHRPYVDEVTFPCPHCAGRAARVPEVLDVWFDSGAMPFAQWGAPYRNEDEFDASYPAQFICEAIDQTRGWFYTLMAIGTMVFDRSAYENVLCLGLLLDTQGRKMSKHLGNVLEPIPLMDQHGADAVRWYMLASGSPWADRRIGHEALEEIVRKVLLTYWNTAAFQTLYARAAGWTPGASAAAPDPSSRPLLDQWALSELHETVAEVTAAMEAFDAQRAGRRMAQFIDDLSNWYVRRSRRRFWDGDKGALSTLHECLEVLTRLMAPFTPFVTERVWQALMVPVDLSAADSVHLAQWPQERPDRVNRALSRQMALVRRLVELGRAARADSGVKTRQPLARALVGAAGWADLPPQLRAEVAAELNVAAVDTLGAGAGDLVDVIVKPQFRALGKRFGSGTKAVAAAIAAADPAMLAAAAKAGTATLEVNGQPVQLSADELVVTETPRSGWAVASEAGATIALDLEITPALRQAGLARDAIRLVQDGRKAAGLDVSDRIALHWTAPDPLAEALRIHSELLSDEVLAVEYDEGAPDDDTKPWFTRTDPDTNLTLWLRKLER
jgi:isoleucyl-tRNA synthetase